MGQKRSELSIEKQKTEKIGGDFNIYFCYSSTHYEAQMVNISR